MLEILPLRDRPEVIEQLARWHFAQWRNLNPGSTVERRIERLRGHLQADQVPQTFVAVDGATLLGSASLIPADLPSREDLTPWLATVYVDPPHRHRGVGSALVERVVEEARQLGYSAVYLFTPDRQAFYARLGWEVVDQDEWGGDPVTVMQRRLT